MYKVYARQFFVVVVVCGTGAGNGPNEERICGYEGKKDLTPTCTRAVVDISEEER